MDQDGIGAIERRPGVTPAHAEAGAPAAALLVACATVPPEERSVSDLASTQELLDRTKAGDTGARDELLERFVPALSRWAHGRLPHGARDLSETQDLVQLTLMKALSHLQNFEAERPGAFLAWLRTIFMNVLKDELRRHERRPQHTDLVTDAGAERLEVADPLSADDLASYESALALLPDDLREAVVLSLEFGFSHEELAQAIGAPSAEAARMRLRRALLKLAEKMDG
jgi:RNA polymerase sigma-70 factor (ECF subfamily)